MRTHTRTGDYRTDLCAKGQAAVDTLTAAASPYEFGFVHVKAVDDAGHDRNTDLKVHFLEEVDKVGGRRVRMCVGALGSSAAHP